MKDLSDLVLVGTYSEAICTGPLPQVPAHPRPPSWPIRNALGLGGPGVGRGKVMPRESSGPTLGWPQLFQAVWNFPGATSVTAYEYTPATRSLS